MLTKRIIACLDVKDGRTVKGLRFEALADKGDPVQLAAYYSEQGIDELVFLDISATDEKRRTMVELVKSVSRELDIPFTVGGGIGECRDVAELLENGADKISVNTAAFYNPSLLEQIAGNYGSQCLVVAVDVKKDDQGYMVFTHAGKKSTGVYAMDWIQRAANSGAGEILLTSIDRDGTRNGFDNDLMHEISTSVSIPVIASGGAGNAEHFYEVFSKGNADAALAAGIFHEKVIEIPVLKQYLRKNKIAVR